MLYYLKHVFHNSLVRTSTCPFHLRFCWKVIPRNFIVSLPADVVVEKVSNWVLSLFIRSLFTLNHSSAASYDSFVLAVTISKLSFVFVEVASSAHYHTSQHGLLAAISLIYFKNNIGPNIDPLGTPHNICLVDLVDKTLSAIFYHFYI